MSPLSLPIRMEQKRRRARAGVAALVPGIVLIALSVYAFTRGGAEVLGIWAAGLGLGLSVLGVTLIQRSRNAR
jgi:hypothetical protein